MRKTLPYLLYAGTLGVLFAGHPSPIVIVVVALTALLLLAPIRNYASIARPLDPTFEECGTGDVVLPPKPAHYFANIRAALSGRGFQSFPVYRCRTGGQMQVDEFLQVHESPSTGDVAIAIATVSPRCVLSMLEFRTRLRGDRELRTSNLPVPELKELEGVTLNRLPLETDPLRLYEAHRASVDKLPNERVTGRPVGNPVAFLKADHQREVEYEVTHGQSVVDRRTNTVRPTFRKALRLAFRGSAPASRMRVPAAPKDTTRFTSPRPTSTPRARA